MGIERVKILSMPSINDGPFLNSFEPIVALVFELNIYSNEKDCSYWVRYHYHPLYHLFDVWKYEELRSSGRTG